MVLFHFGAPQFAPDRSTSGAAAFGIAFLFSKIFDAFFAFAMPSSTKFTSFPFFLLTFNGALFDIIAGGGNIAEGDYWEQKEVLWELPW